MRRYHGAGSRSTGNTATRENVKQDIQDLQRNTRFTERQDIQRDTASGPPSTANRRRAIEDGGESRSGSIGDLLDLPFDQFIVKAWKLCDDADVEVWHSELFHFVRSLRGHRAVRDLAPKAAMKVVEEHLSTWTRHRRSLGNDVPHPTGGRADCWYEWFGLPRADARVEFTSVWEKVRFTPGVEPLDQAYVANQKMRLTLPADVRENRPVSDAADRDTQDYEFFVGLALHLQVIMGDKPILLPCERVGELLRVSPMTISRYRKWAAEDGFVKVAKEHTFRSGRRGDATEFRAYVGGCPELAKRAQQGTQASYTYCFPAVAAP